MADHSVSAGAIGTPAFALTAGQVSTVTFADDLVSVDVISDGTAAVWWTYDGSTPNPATGNGWYIPGAGVDNAEPSTAGQTIVKLLSVGTPIVRVARGH